MSGVVGHAGMLLGPPAVRTYRDEVLADSPILYWRLDETSGTAYADSSGNGRSGTGSGAISQGHPPVFAGGGAGSVRFGAGSLVQRADPWPIFQSSFSLECTFQLDSIASDCYLMGRGYGPAANSWAVALRVAGGGQLQFLVVTTEGGDTLHNCVGPVGGIVVGTPYHVVAKWTSGVGSELYVQGASIAALAWNIPTMRAGTGIFTVGQGINNTTVCTGRVDEVACYSAPLSAGRIAAHYAARDR